MMKFPKCPGYPYKIELHSHFTCCGVLGLVTSDDLKISARHAEQAEAYWGSVAWDQVFPEQCDLGHVEIVI